MTPKHTKTPWTAKGTEVLAHIGDSHVVVCRCVTNGISRPQAEANARLIAVSVNRYRAKGNSR